MTHQYILIEADGIITPQSRFCKVTISDTKMGRKQQQKLTFYAKSNGHYFSRHTIDVARFLQKVASSLDLEVYELPFISINADLLLKHIKSFNQCPSKQAVSRESAYSLATLQPAKYIHSLYYKMPKRNT